mgnify:FL=1
MQHALTRRRRLLAAMALAMAPGVRAASEDAFGALRLPAIAVRAPEKAVLLAATTAGQRLVAVGERGVVALSDDGAQHWHQARGVPVSVTLTAVAFADARNGWAVGHGGVVLATHDGGEQWTLLIDGRGLGTVALDAARAHPEQVALTKAAELLVADGPDKPLLALQVIDAQRLFVVGAYNLAFESNDAGRTWHAALDRMDNPTARHLNALAVRGDTWLIAGEQGLLLRSRDGGRSFQRLNSPYAGSWFALQAVGTDAWVVAGLRGKTFRSTDDGEHWTALEGAPAASFVSAAFLPGGGVLLANQAGQLFTNQNGSALTAMPVPALPPINQVLRLPNGDLLALTLAGAIRLPAKAAP